MPRRKPARRSDLGGLLAVGLGAVAGTILGIPLLAIKNPMGLLAPIVGAAVGGTLRRRLTVDGTASKTAHAASRGDQADAADSGCEHGRAAIGWGVGFLVLGPVAAVVVYGLMRTRDVGHPPFVAVMLFGIVAGLAGYTGSLFLTRR